MRGAAGSAAGKPLGLDESEVTDTHFYFGGAGSLPVHKEGSVVSDWPGRIWWCPEGSRKREVTSYPDISQVLPYMQKTI